jgi:hypothetical protein
MMVLTSCGQIETKSDSNTKVESDSKVVESSEIKLTDKSVKFLWRDMKYDSTLNDTFNSIFINKDYLESMTDPEKAALGYVASFIGNECWWDGAANDERSNLDCRIITALGLGYQCSKEHLGFLQRWFSTDKLIMSELGKSNCPTTPYTATSQTTFDEIKLMTRNDTIIVFYQASGVNMREQASWQWSESNYFILTDNHLKLFKKDKSEVKYETFVMSEE